MTPDFPTGAIGDLLDAFEWDSERITVRMVDATSWDSYAVADHLRQYINSYANGFDQLLQLLRRFDESDDVDSFGWALEGWTERTNVAVKWVATLALHPENVGRVQEGAQVVAKAAQRVVATARAAMRTLPAWRAAQAQILFPSEWRGHLEGFDLAITVIPAERAGRLPTVDVPTLQRALRAARRRLHAAFPRLLAQAPRIHAFYGGSWPYSGRYTFHSIQLFPDGQLEDNLVRTLCHEFGHVVWPHLGADAQAAWTEHRLQVGSISLRDVYLLWRWALNTGRLASMDRGAFIRFLMRQDEPAMTHVVVQLEHRSRKDPDDALRNFAALEDVIEAGTDRVVAIAHPLTAYAETNPEEAFCEAFGLLMAYGPQRVPAETRAVLRHILPEFRWQAAPPLQGR